MQFGVGEVLTLYTNCSAQTGFDTRVLYHQSECGLGDGQRGVECVKVHVLAEWSALHDTVMSAGGVTLPLVCRRYLARTQSGSITTAPGEIVSYNIKSLKTRREYRHNCGGQVS